MNFDNIIFITETDLMSVDQRWFSGPDEGSRQQGKVHFMNILNKRFIHNCDQCEWRFQNGHFDMYLCQKAENENECSIIARYGDIGYEYASYPLSILFRPFTKNFNASLDSSFLASAKTALDLYMSGRIELKFKIHGEKWLKD